MRMITSCFVMIVISLSTLCKAQNFSGLQNKKLNKVEDLSSALESLLSRLGGNMEGSIDSVVVVYDGEKELRFRVFYTGFLNGYFSVTPMGFSREQQPAVTGYKFNQATSGSPAEGKLFLDGKLANDAELETPYLRIDISSKENRPGKVRIYELRKTWKTEDAVGVATGKKLIPVMLQPVGIAGKLGPTPIDQIPAKKIIFDTKTSTRVTPYRKVDRTIKTTGNSFYSRVMLSPSDAVDISGTWINVDVNTTGFSKLLIANNNSVRVYKKCAGKDCDQGGFPLFPTGTDSYTARVVVDGKSGDLNLKLANNELKVDHVVSLVFSKKTTHYIFKKEAIGIKANILLLNENAFANWAVANPPSTSTVPEGPVDTKQVNLWNEIAVDPQVEFLRPQDISNININIFGDKNLNSGIYYILPADYHVRWEEKKDPTDGYAFLMTYGKQPGDALDTETEAPVRFSATLTPGISSRERALVKAILQTLDPYFKNIVFLPLREAPVSTLASTLNAQYGIPLDRISVTSSSDLTTDIKVSWRTNADTKEFIQTALTTGEGISASMVLKPKNTNIIDLEIPVTINLADPRSLGKMNLDPVSWRNKYWKNSTPYPLQLKYLHVMKKANPGKNLIIYSWAMDNIEVPSLSEVSFDHSKVPVWLDNDPTSVMWLEYDVVECPECDRNVIRSVTKGVFGGATQLIGFNIAPGVFDSLNAEYFMITMRSKQADPTNEVIKELEALRITKDPLKKFTTGPLFLAPGVTPDFEYQITVATKDEFYRSTQWIKATDKDIYLGFTALKDIFRGIIPGIN